MFAWHWGPWQGQMVGHQWLCCWMNRHMWAQFVFRKQNTPFKEFKHTHHTHYHRGLSISCDTFRDPALRNLHHTECHQVSLCKKKYYHQVLSAHFPQGVQMVAARNQWRPFLSCGKHCAHMVCKKSEFSEQKNALYLCSMLKCSFVINSIDVVLLAR